MIQFAPGSRSNPHQPPKRHMAAFTDNRISGVANSPTVAVPERYPVPCERIAGPSSRGPALQFSVAHRRKESAYDVGPQMTVIPARGRLMPRAGHFPGGLLSSGAGCGTVQSNSPSVITTLPGTSYGRSRHHFPMHIIRPHEVVAWMLPQRVALRCASKKPLTGKQGPSAPFWPALPR